VSPRGLRAGIRPRPRLPKLAGCQEIAAAGLADTNFELSFSPTHWIDENMPMSHYQAHQTTIYTSNPPVLGGSAALKSHGVLQRAARQVQQSANTIHPQARIVSPHQSCQRWCLGELVVTTHICQNCYPACNLYEGLTKRIGIALEF
jgi:hypothetical protein